MAAGDRGAGPRPGGGRRDPGQRREPDRGARAARPARPRVRGGADAAVIPFHARPDPRPAGGAAGRRTGVRLRRRHRPGHHRHRDRAGAAPDRRHRLAGPAAYRGAAAGTRRRAQVHRDGGPHPRPARQPGDVRLEGGLLGGRGPPPSGPAPGGRTPLAGRAARRRRGQPGVLRGARARGPGRLLRRARAGRSGHLVAVGARPRRRVRPASRADLRHARPDRR